MADPFDFDVAAAFYQQTGILLPTAVDQVLQQSAFGSIDRANGDNYFGLNHRQTPPPLGINRDYYGLTFFTRPRLNLSTENARTVRKFGHLLTNQTQSLPRIIRCLLDPTLAQSQSITSEFVDPLQAFIPLLTNTMQSITGWPDLEALTFVAHEGIMKESYSFVDSSIELYGTYDITANFRNIPGDPILLMFYVWLYYSSYVYLGTLIPYPDALIANEIDYMTRIYRLVLDPSRRFVTKIAATGASFPTNVPFGAAINHDAEHPINQNTAQISISFKSNGIMYGDTILMDEFNRTVALFNPAMADAQFTSTTDPSTGLPTSTNSYYQRIPLSALKLFNNRGYPRINLTTHELEWWVDPTEYSYRQNLVSAAAAASTTPPSLIGQ